MLHKLSHQSKHYSCRGGTGIKVEEVGPSCDGRSFRAKVVSCAVRVTRQAADGTVYERAADFTIGDETGCVFFTATNEQIEMLQPGRSVTLTNPRVWPTQIVKRQKPRFFVLISCHEQVSVGSDGYLRVSIDRWGLLEPLEPGLICEVDLDNNRSQVNVYCSRVSALFYNAISSKFLRNCRFVKSGGEPSFENQVMLTSCHCRQVLYGPSASG
jgi:hypothetical protein